MASTFLYYVTPWALLALLFLVIMMAEPPKKGD